MVFPKKLVYESKTFLFKTRLEIKHSIEDARFLFSSLVSLKGFGFNGSYSADSIYQLINDELVLQNHQWQSKHEKSIYTLKEKNLLSINHCSNISEVLLSGKVYCPIAMFSIMSSEVPKENYYSVAAGKKVYGVDCSQTPTGYILSDNRGRSIILEKPLGQPVNKITTRLGGILPLVSLKLVDYDV